MFVHTLSEPIVPSRVVIIGGTGVIGRVTTRYLCDRDIPVMSLGSKDFTLLEHGASRKLALMLRPADAVVVLAGLAPNRGRGLETMLCNIEMGIVIYEALLNQPVSHVVYLSSDAVYPRRIEDVNESSVVEPSDPYSAMHLIRERLFSGLPTTPVAILRATQVSALEDTHDAYGPNRFRGMAMREKRIVLFGKGEEMRDHIMVQDVAAVMHLCLTRRSFGIMNLATGRSLRFAEVANIVATCCVPTPTIEYAPRTVPITHRRFDVSVLRQAFPQFKAISLEAGESALHHAANPSLSLS
jgi:UDP-glucose 4-epimerase